VIAAVTKRGLKEEITTLLGNNLLRPPIEINQNTNKEDMDHSMSVQSKKNLSGP